MPNKKGNQRTRRTKRPAPPDATPKAATCGDTTEGGTACRLPAGWGTGRLTGKCALHDEPAADQLARDKAVFLAELGKGTMAATAAAKAINKDLATVWRWRQRDPEFDAAYHKVVDSQDSLRLTMVEDSQFKRIVDGTHHGGEAIWWMKNRGPSRWKDRNEVNVSGSLDLDPRDVRRELYDRLLRRLNTSATARVIGKPNAGPATGPKS